MGKAILGIIPLFLVFFILINQTQAYTTDFYSFGNQTGTNIININSSSLSPNSGTTCSVKLRSYLTLTGSNFNAQADYLSPVPTVAGYSPLENVASFQFYTPSLQKN